jgi:hypothetical protein
MTYNTPWEVNHERGQLVQVIGADCTPIATCYGPEQREHAALIASAPELLAALNGLFEHCAMIAKYGGGGEGDNTKQADAALKAARAAIERATR